MMITEGAIADGYAEGDFRQYMESLTPMGRIGQTEEIAPAALFFASDDSVLDHRGKRC
jgi:3-oxoacyl-[acyl-carrier protein] reductase